VHNLGTLGETWKYTCSCCTYLYRGVPVYH